MAKLGLTPADSGLEWVPKETVAIDDEARTKLDALREALDAHDDVQDIYSNEL